MLKASFVLTFAPTEKSVKGFASCANFCRKIKKTVTLRRVVASLKASLGGNVDPKADPSGTKAGRMSVAPLI